MNTKKMLLLIVLCLVLLAVPFARRQPVAAMSLGGLPDATRLASSTGLDQLGWNLQLGPNGLPRFLSGSANRLAAEGGLYEAVGLDGYATIKEFGDELYVAGDFTYHSRPSEEDRICLARWTALGGWETLARCSLTSRIRNIAVDENYVYVGGNFETEGGFKGSRIARWNRHTREWSPMGQGLVGGGVSCIVIDAAGNVYVGGSFSQALPGAPEANGLAVWDGANWWSLSQGFVDGYVNDLALKNGKLYVAGRFRQVGGGAPYYPISVNNVAVWDGTWHALGNGIPQEEYGSVLAIDADANGKVYAGGGFYQPSAPFHGVLQWDPATGAWSPLGADLAGGIDGKPSVYDIQVGSNGVVFAAGNFDRAGQTAPEANHLAKFEQGNWYSLAQSMPNDSSLPVTRVRHIALSNDGYLYAAGLFRQAGGPIPTAASNVARFEWSTSSWLPLSGWVK